MTKIGPAGAGEALDQQPRRSSPVSGDFLRSMPQKPTPPITERWKFTQVPQLVADRPQRKHAVESA
ncbi:MAG TPA: hypothetical protein VMZ33_01515 [Candidatus Limnocylindrales bacterium]|nr:hypothetical protein [Candidatus Limnocylindrales bacterium]